MDKTENGQTSASAKLPISDITGVGPCLSPAHRSESRQDARTGYTCCDTPYLRTLAGVHYCDVCGFNQENAVEAQQAAEDDDDNAVSAYDDERDADGLGPRIVEGVTLDYWLVGDDGLMDGPTYRNVANVEGDNDDALLDACERARDDAEARQDYGGLLRAVATTRHAPPAALLRDIDHALGPVPGFGGPVLHDWVDADTEGEEAKRAASGQPKREEWNPLASLALLAIEGANVMHHLGEHGLSGAVMHLDARITRWRTYAEDQPPYDSRDEEPVVAIYIYAPDWPAVRALYQGATEHEYTSKRAAAYRYLWLRTLGGIDLYAQFDA